MENYSVWTAFKTARGDKGADPAACEMNVANQWKIPARLVSIDAYRGFVMLLMMAEVLALGRVAEAFPGSGFWGFLATTKTTWRGSVARCTTSSSRRSRFWSAWRCRSPSRAALARGQSPCRACRLHALWRALVLVAAGRLPAFDRRAQTNFTFEDTLTQIGLGYFFLFLLGLPSARSQWMALAVILVGYWALFALYPLPGRGLRLAKRRRVAPTGSTTWPASPRTGTRTPTSAWAFDSGS